MIVRNALIRAAKETAKRIFDDLGGIHIHPALDRLKDFEWFRLLAKKYGVEVTQ